MYSDFDFIVFIVFFSFNFSSVVVCIFHFYCSVFLVFVLPSGVIKNDDSEHILYLSVRQSTLAGRIMFSTCPSVRPSVRSFVCSSVTNL